VVVEGLVGFARWMNAAKWAQLIAVTPNRLCPNRLIVATSDALKNPRNLPDWRL